MNKTYSNKCAAYTILSNSDKIAVLIIFVPPYLRSPQGAMLLHSDLHTSSMCLLEERIMTFGNGALSDMGEQLLAALDGGMIVMGCDGTAYVIDGRGSISCVSASDQITGVIRELIANPMIEGSVAKKLTTLLKLLKQEVPGSTTRLTSREEQILKLICRGLSDPAIADALGLSPNTIRNHVASLYRKLGIHSRSAAVIWAYQEGIAEGGNSSDDKRERSSSRKETAY